MKKNIILLICLLLILPLKVNATTLQDYKNKVASLEAKAQENRRLTNEAKNNIAAKRNAITEANNTISNNENKVEESKVLVTKSEEEIKVKTEEMKDLIISFEYSNSSNTNPYMNYIFESTSISDLIQRQAVVEQITNHTQEELNKLSDLIDENKKLQVKLEEDNVNLANSITKYEKQLDELDKYIDSLASIGLDYSDQIAAQKGLIKIYEEAGCKNSDDIDVCYYSKMLSSSSFSRPLNKGTVTQAWNSTHGAIDIGGNTPGTNIYAPASGTVVYVKYKASCGGNIIYMHALVNGQKYTLEFAHLRNVYVSNGQQVTKGAIIGTVGGDSSTWYYDSCTSGTHLHYAISYGYYFTNATYGNQFYTFKSNTKATSVQSISGIKSQKGWKWTTR